MVLRMGNLCTELRDMHMSLGHESYCEAPVFAYEACVPTIAAAALDDQLFPEVVFCAELTENCQINQRKDQTM